MLNPDLPEARVLPPSPWDMEGWSPDAWTPQSWQKRPTITQEIDYIDPSALEDVLRTIASLPPLVSPVKIELARQHFAAAARGEAFVLQGGDCAESFQDVRPLIVQQKVQLLLEQSRMISGALSLPVVVVGRIAGQYAKPRSCPWETMPDGTQIPSFRGENVNGPHPDDRNPDPSRLLQAYFHSRATLDLMKACPSLLTPPSDDLASPGPDLDRTNAMEGLGQGAIFTSHEALHLPYESTVTHGRYNTSATFVWIGERTRHGHGPHIEYVRGLRNPIGIKVGPSMKPQELVDLLDILLPPQDGPDTNDGRVTIITRLGAEQVETVLPPLIQAVRIAGHRPVWMCDPCHGNTKATPSGIKTRCVETIVRETVRTFETHRAHGSFLGGLHLEQTGEAVTECVGDWNSYSEKDLMTSYRTLCDPRLSYTQALTVVQSFLDHARCSGLQGQDA